MPRSAAGRIGLISSLLGILVIATLTARWIARSEAAACTTPISIEVVAIRQNVAHTAVECKDREKRVRENTSAVIEIRAILPVLKANGEILRDVRDRLVRIEAQREQQTGDVSPWGGGAQWFYPVWTNMSSWSLTNTSSWYVTNNPVLLGSQ